MNWFGSTSSSSSSLSSKHSFHDVDLDKDGHISLEELEVYCKNFKIPISKKQIQTLFKSIGKKDFHFLLT